MFHQERGLPPNLDLKYEKRIQTCCRNAHVEHLLKSAHDCSEGGLAVALAECCVMDERDGLGAEVRVEEGDLRPDFVLFAETPSRIIVTVSPGNEQRLLSLADDAGVAARVIGRVGGDFLKIATGRVKIDLEVRVIGQPHRRRERRPAKGPTKRSVQAHWLTFPL